MRLYLLCQQKNNRGLYFLVIFLSIKEIFLLGDANALLDCFALLAMTVGYCVMVGFFAKAQNDKGRIVRVDCFVATLRAMTGEKGFALFRIASLCSQ